MLLIMAPHLIHPSAEGSVRCVRSLGPRDVAVTMLRLEIEEVLKADLPRFGGGHGDFLMCRHNGM